MDDNNAGHASAQAQVIGRKSWLAYFGVAVLALILLGGVLPLAFRWNDTAAACVLAASGAILFYRIALLQRGALRRRCRRLGSFRRAAMEKRRHRREVARHG